MFVDYNFETKTINLHGSRNIVKQCELDSGGWVVGILLSVLHGLVASRIQKLYSSYNLHKLWFFWEYILVGSLIKIPVVKNKNE